ncbi:MAG: phosphatase PAP2 family protein [Acidobacteria bacterium]|nr:phosphatase PAP2 family protein [Acidobacteriota bacterium]
MSTTKTEISRWRQTVQRSINRGPGFQLFVTSIAAFVVLAVLVASRASWIVSLDGTVQEELIELRRPWLNETMIWVTRLGSRWTIGTLLLLLAVWVVRTGRCQRALTVMTIAFLANPPLEYALKTIVDRPRPDLARLVPGNGPSFPSGHVLATVGFYGVLAAVLWRSSNRTAVRVAGYVAATTIILGVAISRVYLDVHWFSDVVGALLVGTAFVITVAWSLRGHHFGGELGCEFSTRTRISE